MRPITAIQRLRRRQRRQNRRHPSHPFPEPHVVVPLVIRFERLHPARHFMLRQTPVTRIPVRIHRPVSLKIPARPLHEQIAALSLRNLHRIVNAPNAHPLRLRRFHFRQMRHHHVTATTIRIHHQRIRIVEHRRIRRPSIRIHRRINPLTRTLIQQPAQQHATRTVLVIPWPVTHTPSHKHHFLHPLHRQPPQLHIPELHLHRRTSMQL